MRPLDHLMHWRGFVVAFVLLVLLSLANAAGSVPPTGTVTIPEWRTAGGYGNGSSSGSCAAFVADNFSGLTDYRIYARVPAETQNGFPVYSCNRRDGEVGGEPNYGGNFTTHVVSTSTGPDCPANSTADGSSCACNEGFGPDDAGTACVVGCSATAGSSREVNFTVGYTRTSNDDDYALVAGRRAVPAAGSTMCDGACTVTVGTPQRAWHSLNPSENGLYRTSVDVTVTGTAGSCTAKTAGLDPTEEPTPCDGTVGYINGKRTCVKSTASPDPVVPAPATEFNGNPSAGSAPNPSNPNSPAGREPTGGTGGPDGGPPSGEAGGTPRGSGSGPSTGGAGGGQGSGEFPEIKDPCGIPGGAPCKIDESGTPNGEGALADSLEGLDAAQQDILDLIGGIKENPGPPPWTWTFELPTGCSPIPVGGFAPWLDPIDICEFQPMFHDVMSVLWLLGTVGGCVTLLYRTLIGGD